MFWRFRQYFDEIEHTRGQMLTFYCITLSIKCFPVKLIYFSGLVHLSGMIGDFPGSSPTTA